MIFCTKSWKSSEYFILIAQLNSDKVTSQVLKRHLWLVTTISDSTAVDDAASF